MDKTRLRLALALLLAALALGGCQRYAAAAQVATATARG